MLGPDLSGLNMPGANLPQKIKSLRSTIPKKYKKGGKPEKGEEEVKKVRPVSPHLMLAALVKRSLFVRQQVDTSKVCLSLIQLSLASILSRYSYRQQVDNSKVCFPLITLQAVSKRVAKRIMGYFWSKWISQAKFSYFQEIDDGHMSQWRRTEC